MQKERFKIFVRNHPTLVSYVQNKKMTWQQFYELYDLYGEDNSIWENFLNDSSVNNDSSRSASNSNNITGTIKDFLGLFRGIDVNTVQKTLTSLDKALETFKGMSSNREINNERVSYEERPKYKYFED